jgi:hypothetical protein
MRRRLPCVSHEPLPIRLRTNALDHGVRTGPAPPGSSRTRASRYRIESSGRAGAENDARRRRARPLGMPRCPRAIRWAMHWAHLSSSPQPTVPGRSVSERQQSPTFFVRTRLTGSGARARAQGSSYSRAEGRRLAGRLPRWPRGRLGAKWGRTDRVRGTAFGRTAWPAAPLRRRSPWLRTSLRQMKPGRASGPRDPSGASPPPHCRPAFP